MKKIIVMVAGILASTVTFSQKSPSSQKKGAVPDTGKHATLYTCPMHKDVKEIKAGNCPICGMKLTLTSKEQAKAQVMKNYICPTHVDVLQHDPGNCPQCGKKLNLSTKEQMKAESMKLYTCPMHPKQALDKDGKCPQCGKAAVKKEG